MNRRQMTFEQTQTKKPKSKKTQAPKLRRPGTSVRAKQRKLVRVNKTLMRLESDCKKLLQVNAQLEKDCQNLRECNTRLIKETLSLKKILKLHRLKRMHYAQRTNLNKMKTTLVNLRTYRGIDGVLIDRRTIFGNPYPITSVCSRGQSVAKYKVYFYNRIAIDYDFLCQVLKLKLKGKKLACWCTPKACHGDVIIEYLESLK